MNIPSINALMGQKLLLCATVMLAACSADDEPQVSHLTTLAQNPTVYLYIEDQDGHDLLSAGRPVNVVVDETGLPLPYRVEPDDGRPLPWGGHGALLAVTPPQPVHVPGDGEYVYTLDPHVRIGLGLSQDIVLQRVFDYDLRRHQGHNSMDVDVAYTPLYTLLLGAPLQSDTAHIIVDHDYPYLRVEGPELTLTMLFPAGTDTLATLPLSHNTTEGLWLLGQQMQVRLLYTGLTIAQPHESVIPAVYHRQLPAADGTPSDEQGLQVQVCLQLPSIYSQGSYGVQNYIYHYLVSCPAVFGSDVEHSVELELYSYNGELHLNSMFLDYIWCDPQYLDPTHIEVDWSQYPTP